jgi:hypothetical protein
MKKIAFILLTAIVWTAFAEDSTETNEPQQSSEFLHQAEGKTFELTGELGYDTITKSFDDGTSSTETAFSISPTAEYGFTHYFSLGFSMPFVRLSAPGGSNPQGTSAESFTDPELYGKLRIDGVGPGSLRLQLTYAPSSGNASAGKNYSGGTLLTSSIGYEVAINRHVFGLREKYSAYIGDRNVGYFSDVADFTVTGGETFTSQFVYEYNREPLTYGFSFSMSNQSTSRYKSNPGMLDYLASLGSPDPEAGTYTSANRTYAAEAYIPIDIAPNFRLIPSVTYTATEGLGELQYSTFVPKIGSAAAWQIGSAARVSF